MTSPLPPIDSTHPEPHLDFTKIDFPTDRLTIQAVRQRFPDALDAEAPGQHMDLEKIELPAMLRIERNLAKWAFDAALGKSPFKPGSGPVGLLDIARYKVGDLYVRYGLAKGTHHAEQLIRAFEQAAADQARQHMPDPPPR
jgi:hypothetical protein